MLVYVALVGPRLFPCPLCYMLRASPGAVSNVIHTVVYSQAPKARVDPTWIIIRIPTGCLPRMTLMTIWTTFCSWINQVQVFPRRGGGVHSGVALALVLFDPLRAIHVSNCLLITLILPFRSLQAKGVDPEDN